MSEALMERPIEEHAKRTRKTWRAKEPLDFSKWEMKVFDVVVASISLKEAAAKLGVSTQRLYNHFYALRQKFYRRYSWCNRLNGQRSRSKLLTRVLQDRKHGSLKRSVQLALREEKRKRQRILEGEEDESAD